MNKLYLFLSATVFACVAVLHAVRLYNHWDVQLGPWTVPMDFSLIGIGISGLLMLWGLGLMSKKE